MSLSISVDSGREDGARQLDFLRDLEAPSNYAPTLPHTVKTHSVVDTPKRITGVLTTRIRPGLFCLRPRPRCTRISPSTR